jgi:hypothetical protein
MAGAPAINGALFKLVLSSLLILSTALGLLLILNATQPWPALAQGGSQTTHTSVADFGAVCSTITNTSVSSAGGGEVRLAATVEDYFDDTVIDSNRWLSGFVFDWYTAGPPTEAGGVLTLDGSYLRAQPSFTQSIRFYEARARLRINSNGPGDTVLGFMRQNPPLSYQGPDPEQRSIRLFITSNNGNIFVRARDGDSTAPVTDIPVTPPTILSFIISGSNGIRLKRATILMGNYRRRYQASQPYFPGPGSMPKPLALLIKAQRRLIGCGPVNTPVMAVILPVFRMPARWWIGQH